MRERVSVVESAGRGPRVLLLPGLGARGEGFRTLATALSTRARPVIVEYPEGARAGTGAGALAREVMEAVGPVEAVVASSFGGMVAAHLAAAGAVKGAAFLGSFTDPAQLGFRGRLLFAMGPIAAFGRPGALAAGLAAASSVRRADVPRIVPTTAVERWSVWHRAFALGRERPPPSLAGSRLACVAIHGARDVLVPVSTLLRLAEALPVGSPVHVLPGAGHVPYFTHPADCARLLAPWIARIERGAPAS